jgi:FkbM family methyltransferase
MGFEMDVSVKAAVRKAMRRCGLVVSRASNVGHDPFADMRRFLGAQSECLIFNVGANTGYTTRQFREYFPRATIHSFEPSPSTFLQLQQSVGSDPNTHLWNLALGAARDRLMLNENEQSFLSSFLPLGSFETTGQVIRQTIVDVETVDSFCRQHDIGNIDILKSDTEGYELEVFNGAQRMLSGRVKLVYFEVNFADKYVGQASFGKQFELLECCGFRFVSFYEVFRKDNVATWTDALFVHRSISGS